MNKKVISYFLIFLTLLIVVVIVANYINSKPKKAKQNPYGYNVDEFKKVDPGLISHNEVRQIKVPMGNQGGIATANGRIYFASEGSVKTLSPEGQVLSEFPLTGIPVCIAADQNQIVAGFKQGFSRFSLEGKILFQHDFKSDSVVITSVSIWNDLIVLADAGRRRVYLFKDDFQVLEMEGVSGAKNLHGFIVPSAKFDLAVNNAGELWVVNPGMHALQQYDGKGNLLKTWDKASLQIEGFSGCCNPAHFTFLPDGRFVTSEKNIPRIKIYSTDGQLESVAAPPSKFADNGQACDVATLDETIVALDYDQKMIRIFEMK